MMKQAQNTFEKGMALDFHPLTVQNSVMTDALNATLITKKGNEWILQNDMGNGRVESAYLPAGYIPVGMKEYGGIIYVASYNPLTGKSQLGSFPSPERNLDSDETKEPKVILDLQNFYEGETLSTLIYKLKLLDGDIKVLHSGDKFSIYFTTEDDTILELLSDYNQNGNVTRNNTLTLSLAVLDSNNNLRDITKTLRRVDAEGNVITAEATNNGYWMSKFPTTDTGDVDAERAHKAINVYNNKLYGELYIVARINTISYIESGVTAGINNDEITLNFDTYYHYNCPTEDIAGVDICIDDTDHYYQEFNAQEEDYDEITNSYFVSNKSYLKLPIIKDDTNLYKYKNLDILSYSITPNMSYGSLDTLTLDGRIDLNRIGTGEIKLSTWKYYNNSDNVQITWGLDAYPRHGDKITNIQFNFYDLLKEGSLLTFTYTPAARSSYNGVFGLNISYTNKVLEKQKVYLVELIYYVNGIKQGKEYRLLITTPLYNNLYNYKDNDGNVINDYDAYLSANPEYNQVYLVNNIKRTAETETSPETTTSGELLSFTEQNSFNISGITKSTYTCKFIQDIHIIDKLQSYYPFIFDQTGLTSSYTLKNTNPTVTGSITKVGEDDNYNLDINQIQATAKLKDTTLTLNVELPSQIIGQSITRDITIHNIFKPFLSKDSAYSVLGYDFKSLEGNEVDPDEADNLMTVESVVLGVGSLGRGGHRDSHYWKGGIQVKTDYTYDETEKKKVLHSSSQMWEDSEFIQFDFGDHPIVRNLGDNMQNFNTLLSRDFKNAIAIAIESIHPYDATSSTWYDEKWRWQDLRNDKKSVSAHTLLRDINSGAQHYNGVANPNFQMLLWYTGSGYVLSNFYITKNTVELPKLLYNAFKDIVILKKNSGNIESVYSIDENLATYNESYKANVNCSIEATISDTSNLESHIKTLEGDKPFKKTVEDSLDKLKLPKDINTKLRNQLNFTVDTSSLQAQNITISEVFTAPSLKNQLNYLQNYIDSGLDNAIIYNNTIITTDATGKRLDSNCAYYVEGDKAYNLMESSLTNSTAQKKAKLISNFKVADVNGDNQLIAKNYKVLNNYTQHYFVRDDDSDSDTELTFKSTPNLVWDIDNFKELSGATNIDTLVQ